MNFKFLSFAFLLIFVQLEAQSQDYFISKKDKNILNNTGRDIQPVSLKAAFKSCYNTTINFSFSYKQKAQLYGININTGSTSNIETESWNLNFIQYAENGDYIYSYQAPAFGQYLRTKEGLVTNQVETIIPDPYIIFISKDNQKIYIFTKTKDDYRPFLVAHSNIEQSKSLSVKKDKAIFNNNFTSVNTYFEKQEILKGTAKQFLEGKIKIGDIKLTNSLFYFLS